LDRCAQWTIFPFSPRQEYQKIGGDGTDAYHGITNWRYILTQELTIRGFICGKVSAEAQKRCNEELAQYIKEGKVKTE
jgi:NADPH-dependent curcumin reductase CurA